MERFAFINHPVDIDDLRRLYPLAGYFPHILIKQMSKYSPPFKSSELIIKLNEGNCARGWMVTCPLTESQITGISRKLVLKRIIEAGKAARKLGAEIIGLGGFIPAALGPGELIVGDGSQHRITFGHTYNLLAALEGAKLAAATRGYDPDRITVAVVGASRCAGSICAAILARDVKNLILAGDNIAQLRQMTNTILYDTGLPVKIGTDIQQVLGVSDLVLIDASFTGPEIRPDDFKTGAIICFIRGTGVSLKDVVSLRALQNMASIRNDLIIIDGGLVEVPGTKGVSEQWGLPAGIVYPWMAETLIMALGKNGYCTIAASPLSVKKVDALKKVAKSYGFQVTGYWEVRDGIIAVKLPVSSRAGEGYPERCIG